MRTIFNWVGGSFFRSIGRIIAYIVIGGLIAMLINYNDIKLPSFLGTIFFDSVKADTFNTAHWFTYYTDANKTQALPSSGGSYQKYALTKTNNVVSTVYLYTNDVTRTDNFDYITIPFILSIYYGTNIERDVYCSYLAESGGLYSPVSCKLYNTGTYMSVDFNFQFSISLLEKNGQNQSPCTITTNNIVCSLQKNITYNRILLSYSLSDTSSSESGSSYSLNLNHVVGSYLNSQNAIYNGVNSIDNNLKDDDTSETSSDAEDFFNDTTISSGGSLTSIVSSPLYVINNLVTGSSSDLCVTLKSKNICLPSGNIIWGKTQRSGVNWFGSSDDISSGVNAFKVFFNLVVGGYLCYKIIIGLILCIDRILTPTHTEIEVMKL